MGSAVQLCLVDGQEVALQQLVLALKFSEQGLVDRTQLLAAQNLDNFPELLHFGEGGLLALEELGQVHAIEFGGLAVVLGAEAGRRAEPPALLPAHPQEEGRQLHQLLEALEMQAVVLADVLHHVVEDQLWVFAGV